MDKALQQELQGKLEETREQLKNDIAGLSAPINMGDDIDGGDEEADEAEELGANFGALSSLKARLEDVETALNKIERGVYGICEKSGEAIDIELLRVNPETKHCRKMSSE